MDGFLVLVSGGLTGFNRLLSAAGIGRVTALVNDSGVINIDAVADGAKLVS